MKSIRQLNGYTVLYMPDHQSAMVGGNWGGYIYEHIFVAEQKLGRRLLENEVVHHLDLNRANNAPTNLLVLDVGQHAVLHNWISHGAPLVTDEKYANADRWPSETKYCANGDCRMPLAANVLKYCSQYCYYKATVKGNWPDLETFEEELAIYNLTELSYLYGVSATAVKKMAKRHGFL